MKKKLNTTLFVVLILIFVFQSGCYLNAKIEGLDSKETLGSSSPLLLTANNYNLNLQETDSDIVYTDLELILSKPADEDMAISLQTTDGYASNTIDYKISSQVILPKGKSSVVIPITIVGDVVGEGDENFTIAISSSSAGLQIPNSVIQVNIIENDPISLTVTPLFPNNGANFFDFIQNQAEKKLLQVSDTACTVIPSVKYDTCIDGGLFRKVQAKGQHSCQNLSLQDDLGVFDWKCDSSVDPVIFYSDGMKKNKGMKDILNASAFKNNFVTLKKNNLAIGSSISSIWWINSVSNLALNSGAGAARLTLNTPGTIYTIGSGVSRGIDITSSKVGLVVLSGSLSSGNPMTGDCSASTAGTQECLIQVTMNSNLTYIEGDFSGTSNLSYVLQYSGNAISEVLLARINNSIFKGGGVGFGINSDALLTLAGFSITNTKIQSFQTGIGALRGWNKLYKDCSFTDISGNALSENINSWYSKYINLKFANVFRGISSLPWNAVLQDITISNSSNRGIFSVGQAQIFKNIQINNSSGDGLLLTSSYGTLVSNVSVFNSNVAGLNFDDCADCSYENILAVNNATGMTIANAGAKFADIMLVDNAKGIDFVSSSNGAIFSNKIILGNTTNCAYTSTGANPGLSGANCDNQNLSTATRTLGASASGIFSGLVSSETTNPHATGTSIASSISDWTSFDNLFRFWGNTSGGDFVISGRGMCSGAATCQIWDARIKNTSLPYYSIHGVFTNGQVCPSSVQGDVAGVFEVTTYYLTYATEIFGDRVGNDNGLCESGEECIYSPHIGYYQGEGDYTQNTCVFQNGVTANGVTNVKMYAYPQ